MDSASSVPHDVGNGERALERSSLLATNGTAETFAAFLDKFTEGSWPLPDTREKRSVPFFTDKDHGCQKVYSKEAETASVTPPSAIARGELPCQAPAGACDIAKGELPCQAGLTGACDIAKGEPPCQAGPAGARDIAKGELPCQAPAGACDIARAHPSKSTETCTDSSPCADRDGTAVDASCALTEVFSHKTLFHSSVRKLTNATYLRRMHLSREDAAGLFPEVKSSLDFVYRTKMTRREHSAPFKKGTRVHIYDAEGRRWPVVLECLRTAGQRHVRFNEGWAELCSASGLSIGKSFRLARWKQGSSSLSGLVTLSIV